MFHEFLIYQYTGVNIQHGAIVLQLLKSIVHRLHIVHLAFITGTQSQQNDNFFHEHIVKSHKLYVLAGHTVSSDITLSQSLQSQK